jgi:hypothetical protein
MLASSQNLPRTLNYGAAHRNPHPEWAYAI